MEQRGDSAAIVTAEALIVALLFLGAILFVLAEPGPDSSPAASNADSADLRRLAEDALLSLIERPSSAAGIEGGDLSRLVFAALQANAKRQPATDLESSLDPLLPVGIRYALYLDNGEGTLPVYEPRPPPGQSESASVFLTPSDGYTFLAADAGNAGVPNTLSVYAIPVQNGRVVRDPGIPVTVTVNGNMTPLLGAPRAWSLVRTVSTDRSPLAGLSVVTIEPLDAAGAPTLFFDRTASVNTTYVLRVEEHAGRAVPAGTRLVIDVPRGFGASATAGANPGWTVVAGTTDGARGGTLEATLNASLSGASLPFTFTAPFAVEPYNYYAFTARIENGASGRAEFVVRTQGLPSPTGADRRSVVVSAPRPAGTGEAVPWIVQVDSPFNASTVSSVVIAAPAGTGLFSGVEAIEPATGWTISGDRIAWESAGVPRAVAADAASQFRAKVRAAGSPVGAAPASYVSIPIRFDNGHLAKVGFEREPGVFEIEVPPEVSGRSGYAAGAGVHTLTSLASRAGAPLPGDAAYDAAALPTVRDALRTARVLPSPKTLPPGGQVTISVDVSELLVRVNEEHGLVDVTLETRVYAPWSRDDRVFDRNWSTTVSAVGSNGIYSVAYDVPSGALYGPYPVEVEARWTVPGSVTHTARVLSYFEVTARSGLPTAPLYRADLVVWSEEWD
ncbi:MAG: hypothetical protein ACT4PT_02765 [Methanobacteriota archaeon]